MNHECGSPLPAELGRAGLAGGRDARDLGAGRVATAELALDGRHHRVGDRGRIRAVDDPARRSRARSSGVPRSPLMPVTRRGRISSPPFATVLGDQRHLERRDEGLALPVGRVGQLDVIDEPTRRVAAPVRHLGDRRRQLERQRRPEPEPPGVARPGLPRRSRGRSGRTRCCRRPRSRRRGPAPSSP